MGFFAHLYGFLGRTMKLCMGSNTVELQECVGVHPACSRNLNLLYDGYE